MEIQILPTWDGLTLSQILKDLFHIGKKARHEMRMAREVLRDGQPIDFEKPLSSGDILTFSLHDNPITATKAPLDVRFEDQHLLIVNKPVGVKTHPNAPTETNTLANFVQFHLNQSKSGTAMPVHRLDQTTSGLILFAKHSLSLAALSDKLMKRQIKREYLAILDGVLEGDRTINQPIGNDRHHSGRKRVSPNGQSAETHIHVLEKDKVASVTLVRCKLTTGRTHQIRVHTSSIGHPIIGDTLYGGQERTKRVMLHAERLYLSHPFTEKNMTIEVAPGADWQSNKESFTSW
ncbi:ribosomal large subunit pseudouridine synthase D [Listeria fleischmannii 1991]|uniref:Pseudouridine synthase n=1 Tax=Listeria fleischmannii 1991 TaxID=1430899 RepID=A0A0J8J222_9LIST|nr:RluA family pseudouridine synthase [Listeria fleischmannii]EMG27246.1 ribosomal large subunit pseudouridine synthase D [Listeria fleischmannii subsp. fleischmannii LU2006-1]KMT58381.1 ribosomal large subunit pseudouridine synthase D [Listeria fleischmannii 1991]